MSSDSFGIFSLSIVLFFSFMLSWFRHSIDKFAMNTRNPDFVHTEFIELVHIYI